MRAMVIALISLGLLMTTASSNLMADGEIGCDDVMEEVEGQDCGLPVGANASITTYAITNAQITDTEIGGSYLKYCKFYYEGTWEVGTFPIPQEDGPLPQADDEQASYSWWAEDNAGYSRSGTGTGKFDEGDTTEGSKRINFSSAKIEWKYWIEAGVVNEFASKDKAESDAEDTEECHYI